MGTTFTCSVKDTKPSTTFFRPRSGSSTRGPVSSYGMDHGWSHKKPFSKTKAGKAPTHLSPSTPLPRLPQTPTLRSPYLFQAYAAGHISPSITPVDLQGQPLRLDTRIWQNTVIPCRSPITAAGDSLEGLNDQQISAELTWIARLHGSVPSSSPYPAPPRQRTHHRPQHPTTP